MSKSIKTPVLTLAAAKKQIAILKGRVTKLDNAYQNEISDRIYTVQQMKTTAESREKMYNEMKELKKFTDDQAILFDRLKHQFNALKTDYQCKLMAYSSLYEKFIENENELKAMELSSENWRKAFFDLQSRNLQKAEKEWNTPGHKIKKFLIKYLKLNSCRIN